MKQGLQILVVDDEVSVARAFKLLLEHDGHVIWLVDSGETALAQLAQRKFDLVITDFSMPGMKGDQLVALIRQLLPNQPIIMATAFADEYRVFALPGNSVDALLPKPFSLQVLREAIQQVLIQRQPFQPDITTPGYKGSSPENLVPPPKS